MKDILRMEEELPNDSSALILILEHLWGKKFKEISANMVEYWLANRS